MTQKIRADKQKTILCNVGKAEIHAEQKLIHPYTTIYTHKHACVRYGEGGVARHDTPEVKAWGRP